MESLLAGELRGLGAEHVKQARAGVSFQGTLETAYRVCLWSRLAGRVLLPLATGPAADGDQLYATTSRVDWDAHLGVDGTLAVDFTGTSDTIRDTRYGAVRMKDAVVDQFRARHGDRRPSVDTRAPDLRINGHLMRGRVTISLDLSGDSLHRRGYRTDRVQVEAPLKENLAAAVLLFAAWPQEAAAGGSFLDPLCGSGTLPIEAACMAADVAPGLLRAEGLGGFAFLRWLGHDGAAWQRLVGEARERRAAGLSRLKAAAPGQSVSGSDHDPHAVRVAQACVEHAGLSGAVAISQSDLVEFRAPAARGLVAVNAPYGERLGRREDAEALTRLLGERLRAGFGGWHAAVLAGSPHQTQMIGVPVKRDTTLHNGPLECTLAFYDVDEGGAATTAAAVASAADAPRSARAAVRSSAVAAPAPAPSVPAAPAFEAPAPEAPPAPEAGPAQTRPAGMLTGGAEQFANRLHKNVRRLSRQLRRDDITCYRLYDADLPDYNLVIDVYGDWVHVQEYAPPAEIDPGKVRRRLEDALAVIGSVLDVPPDRVVLKERRRQRGARQYERRASGGDFLTVKEDGLTYLVNLHDYLDTGLFLDQRLTRRLVRTMAGGRRFLNLFAYTGTMTVAALAGGSPASTTVDLSSTYLEWARRNLEANGFSAELELSGTATHGRPAPTTSPHRLLQTDCLRWVADAKSTYDLIWLDPPTFSNSKKMGRATFDVQRDHADLIRMTARRLLAPGGTLLFATNRRGFKLDHGELGGLTVKDLSRATLPFDCARGANRHHVFSLKRSR
jgi:23S rRNA (guanine2445-N2)-methyltransferase / 23S rRNA (guanine2069-N7)-methyltransferase